MSQAVRHLQSDLNNANQRAKESEQRAQSAEVSAIELAACSVAMFNFSSRDALME